MKRLFALLSFLIIDLSLHGMVEQKKYGLDSGQLMERINYFIFDRIEEIDPTCTKKITGCSSAVYYVNFFSTVAQIQHFLERFNTPETIDTLVNSIVFITNLYDGKNKRDTFGTSCIKLALKRAEMLLKMLLNIYSLELDQIEKQALFDKCFEDNFFVNVTVAMLCSRIIDLETVDWTILKDRFGDSVKKYLKEIYAYFLIENKEVRSNHLASLSLGASMIILVDALNSKDALSEDDLNKLGSRSALHRLLVDKNKSDK